MNYFVLTQNSTPIFKWVVKALGLILNVLYEIFAAIGIENVGLCIIVFTLVVKLIMLPLTVKQQKYMKLTAVMNPEIQAIQNKYKNKKDQQSQYAMQQETQALYEKYGASPMGSCLPLLIQFPILIALYRVIMNIAAYVPKIKAYYTSIIEALDISYLQNHEAFSDISGIADVSSIKDLSDTQINSIIDILSGATRGTSFDWSDLLARFPDVSTLYEKVTQINSIGFGIDLSQSPSALFGAGIVIVLAIPALAGLSQWFSAYVSNKISQASTAKNSDNPMNQSMKMMTVMMPLMSVFLCWTLPTGLGLYWILTAVFQVVQTILINKHFNKVDIQDIINENLKKQEKKKKKKGIYAEQVKNQANINTRSISQKANISSSSANEKNTDSHNNSGQTTKASPGGIGAKANMVKDYNLKNKK